MPHNTSILEDILMEYIIIVSHPQGVDISSSDNTFGYNPGLSKIECNITQQTISRDNIYGCRDYLLWSPLLQANVTTYKLPADITNCWKSGHPVVKAKCFPILSMTPLQSYLNEFQHMRGKWGNTVFTCNHTLDNFNTFAPVTPATLGPFTPT